MRNTQASGLSITWVPENDTRALSIVSWTISSPSITEPVIRAQKRWSLGRSSPRSRSNCARGSAASNSGSPLRGRLSESEFEAADPRAQLDRLLGELRPRLHRFCARMTGSVIDGEDIVQETMLKALESFSGTQVIDNPEAWVFRIAHNAVLDFLRRQARQQPLQSDESMDMIIDPATPIEDRQAVTVSLRTFMHLPVAQRGAVILK